MSTHYPVELLDLEEDDGTIVENVKELENAVIGHCTISAEKAVGGFQITLDNGQQVRLGNTEDCCAYTELEAFLLHPELVDHIITGVGTTDNYQTWHIYADMGDILEMTVDWSHGNPFYYAYGFDIRVEQLPDEDL